MLALEAGSPETSNKTPTADLARLSRLHLVPYRLDTPTPPVVSHRCRRLFGEYTSAALDPLSKKPDSTSFSPSFPRRHRRGPRFADLAKQQKTRVPLDTQKTATVAHRCAPSRWCTSELSGENSSASATASLDSDKDAGDRRGYSALSACRHADRVPACS